MFAEEATTMSFRVKAGQMEQVYGSTKMTLLAVDAISVPGVQPNMELQGYLHYTPDVMPYDVLFVLVPKPEPTVGPVAVPVVPVVPERPPATVLAFFDPDDDLPF
jgi:hypothetical protein